MELKKIDEIYWKEEKTKEGAIIRKNISINDLIKILIEKGIISEKDLLQKMGLWIEEHKQGEGFGLTRILLIGAIGYILYKFLK